VVGLLSLHELERLYRLNPVSLAAKKAAAETKSPSEQGQGPRSGRGFERHTVSDRLQTANKALRFRFGRLAAL
jgi:hypothetical protein